MMTIICRTRWSFGNVETKMSQTSATGISEAAPAYLRPLRHRYGEYDVLAFYTFHRLFSSDHTPLPHIALSLGGLFKGKGRLSSPLLQEA